MASAAGELTCICAFAKGVVPPFNAMSFDESRIKAVNMVSMATAGNKSAVTQWASVKAACDDVVTKIRQFPRYRIDLLSSVENIAILHGVPKCSRVTLSDVIHALQSTSQLHVIQL